MTHFTRADGASGGNHKCELCGMPWVAHIAPDSQCRVRSKPLPPVEPEYDNPDMSICFYSKLPLPEVRTKKNTVVIGAVIPQCGSRYLCRMPEGPEGFKASRHEFDKTEQNCNTCYYLERVQGRKRVAHELHTGICKSPIQDVAGHPYKPEAGQTIFHPDDWMGMSCYSNRKEHAGI